MLLIVLFSIFWCTPIVYCENNETISGTRSDFCSICNCLVSTSQTITVDCASRSLQQISSNWPQYSSISATFAGNTIPTLEVLPKTNATLNVVFSSCGIRYLQSGLFQDTLNIKFVDLSYNELTAEEISADKFKGPFNESSYEPVALEELNLAYNHIHSLGKNIFQHMPHLKHLNLEGNHFVVLDLLTQAALASITQLTTLNLANNGLTELVGDAISKNANLMRLDLSNNNIDFVPSSLLLIQNSLQVLILDGNPLIELTSDSFLGLENIVELQLNNMSKIEFVDGNCFVPLINLKKLSLANNTRLEVVDRESFAVNNSIEELNLSNNQLYRLDYTLLNWPQLKIFEFNNNPLECSCDLYNITIALSTDITRNENGPYCTDPVTELSTQVFYLKSDTCTRTVRTLTNKRHMQYHFSMLKLVFVGLSLSLIVTISLVVAIGLTKYRRLQRNSSYPFVSQIIYDPLASGGRM